MPELPPDYALAWADEFSAPELDTAIWEYRTDSKMWSTQTPENVVIRDSQLHLEVRRESRGGLDYTGSGVISRRAFGFGYYEARFRVPPGEGWHTSFWLMTHDGAGGTGTDKTAVEIDICEQDSVNRQAYTVNFHRWKGEHLERGYKVVPAPDLAADFHVWSCLYEAERIRYYFDGALVQETDVRDMPRSDVHIWLTTIATHLGNTKRVDEAALPSAAVFDWVRYYAPAPVAHQ